MKGSQKVILSVVTAVSLLAGAPAFADNGRGNGGDWGRDDDRGRGQNTYIYRNYDHQNGGHYNNQPSIGRTEIIKIYDNDRIILNNYIEDNYRRSDPRGWDRHRHGYTSYYQTSRRYMIGYPLPNEVVYYSVPYEIRSHMRPVPVGYQYVRVDNDVLLMNMASKKIIDAVTLISALGQR